MTLLFSIALQNAIVATFLALLVWGTTRIWKNPPAAHLLWLLVLVKLVTPPLVNLDLGSWVAGPQTLTSVVSRPIVDHPPSPVPKSPDIDVALTPKVDGDPNSVAADELRPAVPARPGITLTTVWFAIRPVLIWTWAGGAGIVALLAGMRIVRFQRMLAGTLPGSQRIRSVVEELANRMELRRSPDVRVADSAVAPFVWCAGGRATVVLPLQLLSALDDKQTAMVLAHELAHLRRRDHWVRALELVVSVLYWWNPLVWSVRRQLHAVEEQCCDAWVAWAYPDRTHDYAQSLLKAAELLSSHAPLAA